MVTARNAAPRRPALWLVGLLGALAVWAGVEAIRTGRAEEAVVTERVRAFRARALSIEGVVVEHERRGRGGTYPIVQFTAPDGRIMRRSTSFQPHEAPVGRAVNILVDPDAFEHFVPDERYFSEPPYVMWALGLILIPGGAFAFLAFGLLLPWLEWRQRRAARGG